MKQISENLSLLLFLATPFYAQSLEYRLAVINADGHVSKNGIGVKRFRYLFQAIDKKVFESEQQIDDMTDQSFIPKKYGKEINILKLMESANKSVPQTGAKLKYTEVMSVVIVLIGE